MGMVSVYDDVVRKKEENGAWESAVAFVVRDSTAE